MKIYKLARVITVIALTLAAGDVYAAPFCVQEQGLPPDCSYYDASACRQRSSQLKAICTGNMAEIHLQPGIGKYCVVDSNHISLCNYSDRDSCDKDAQLKSAVCIEFPDTDIQPNPYRKDPNSKY